MPLDLSKIAIRGTTQQHLDVYDIRDNVLVLKDGSVAAIVQSSAVNFGLLSEPEQDAIIYAYAGMLNSLAFPIQIVLRSKRKDISSYLALLDKAEKEQTNELLKQQMIKYREFIVKTVKENNVLDKKFYIVVPFSSLELGVGSSAKSLFGQTSLPLPLETILTKAKTQLSPKVEHVLRQLGRFGLRAKQLTTPEIIELMFNVYNPDIDFPVGIGTTSYTTATVVAK